MVQFLDPVVVKKRYRGQYLAKRNFDAALASVVNEKLYGGVDQLDYLAAKLLWCVSRAHALVDGNKRASIQLTDEFLAMNDHRLEGSEEDLYEIAMSAATRPAYWIPPLMTPLVAAGAPEQPFADRYPEVIDRLAQ